MTEKKPMWKLVPDSTIMGVILNPRKPQSETVGNNADKKYLDSEETQTELEVSEPQALFKTFDNPILAKSLYVYSRIGYERMKEFLFGKTVNISSPSLQYKELNPRDAFAPILSGFNEDPRIIVKSTKSMKYSVYSGYGKCYKGDLLEIYTEVETPVKYLFRRDYKFNPDTFNLIPCRIPILLSGERTGADKYAGLSLEIMCHQLEPATTRRITRRINQRLAQGHRDLLPQDVEKLIIVGLYEEEVIATGIIRYWLNSTIKNNGLDYQEISGFNPCRLHSKDCELSFLRFQSVSIDRIFDFYNSRKWDIVDYLNGRF